MSDTRIREHPHVWSAVTGGYWWATHQSTSEMLAILEGHRGATSAEWAARLEALEARLGEPLEYSDRVTVRDGVAILPIRGMLFRYANLMTRFSGATSYGTAALDFDLAMSDSSVRAILLHVNSPGGHVDGLVEFADMIFKARGTKPIRTYAGGQMCSAAFLLGAACDPGHLYVDPTCLAGSMGTILEIEDYGEAERKAGIKTYTFTSEQTPGKRADPATKDGAQRIQRLVNRMADVYLGRFAAFRGISVDEVLERSEGGGVMIGEDAVAAGLVDAVSSFEDVLAGLASDAAGMGGDPATEDSGGPSPFLFPARNNMAEQPKTGAAPAAPDISTLTAEALAAGNPTLHAAIRTAGATAERERILAIQGAALPGTDEIVAACITEGVSAGDAALRINKHVREKGTSALAASRADEAAIADAAPPPATASATPAAPGTPAAVAAQVDSILSAGRPAKPAKSAA